MKITLTPPTLTGADNIGGAGASARPVADKGLGAQTLTVGRGSFGATAPTVGGNAVTLEPPAGDVSPEVLGQTAGSVGQLPESRGLTDIFAVMILFHQMGVQMREANREAQLQALQVKIQKLGDVADQVRKAAEKAFWAGVAMGAAQIAGGMLAVTGGAKSLNASKGAVKDLGKANKALTNAQKSVDDATQELGQARNALSQAKTKGQIGSRESTVISKQEKLKYANRAKETAQTDMDAANIKMNQAAQKGQAVNAMWSGSGQAAQGSGQIASAQLNQQAEEERAVQHEEQARAEELGYHYESWGDTKRNQQDVNRDVRETLKSLVAGDHEAKKNVWRSV